jgi:hypothetical protein
VREVTATANLDERAAPAPFAQALETAVAKNDAGVFEYFIEGVAEYVEVTCTGGQGR